MFQVRLNVKETYKKLATEPRQKLATKVPYFEIISTLYGENGAKG
jgi:hypothetical protein